MFKVKEKYSILNFKEITVYDVTYTEDGRPVFLVYNDIDGWKTVDGDCFEPIKEV